MTNALTAYTPNDIMITAKALINSGFLPKSVDSVDKAFAIITLSAELGIGMWQGINGINVISGKPTVSPQLMLALINRSGQLEDMEIDANAERAIVTMKRKGRTPHTETFSMKDAQAMMTTEYANGNKKTIPLAEKYNWKQMPAIMLKWRAVAACARVVFPDAIMGLYTTEEIAPDAVNLTEDGEAVMIERPAELAPQPAQDEPETVGFNLEYVTRALTKQGKTYYRFNDTDAELGSVYTFTREPFRNAGLDVVAWAQMPLDQRHDMRPFSAVGYAVKKGEGRFELVSVEVSHD